MKYGFCLVVTLLYLGIFFLLHQSVRDILVMGVGLTMGIGLLWLDERFGPQWYNETTTHSLITRTPLFWLAYVPLAVFVTTSSGSALGTGLVLGIGLLLWVEMVQLYKSPTAFSHRFLQQVKRHMSETEIHQLVIVASGVLGYLLLTVLW